MLYHALYLQESSIFYVFSIYIMLKSDWSLSKWMNFIVTAIVGIVGIYLYQNMRKLTRQDAITEENMEKKILYTIISLVVLYIIPTNFGAFEMITGQKMKMSNISPDTLILMGISILIIWLPRD